MRFSQYLLLVSITLWLVPVGIFGFWILSDLQGRQDHIRFRELPVLGRAVSADLDRTAVQYQRTGDALLRGGIIRDWILDGEQDLPSLLIFLEDVRQRFDMLNVSIVSDLSETYYGTDNRIVRLSPSEWDRDGWYYLYREAIPDTNLDAWYDHEADVIYLWFNIPVFDHTGRFIGLTGGGLDSSRFTRSMHSFSRDPGLNIYLARRDGTLVYATDISLLTGQRGHIDSIWNMELLEELRRRQDEFDGIVLQPEGSTGPMLWARYAPEWDTFLIVERSADSVTESIFGSVQNLLRAGTVFSLVLIAVLLLVQRIIGRKFLAVQAELDAVKRGADTACHAHHLVHDRAYTLLQETAVNLRTKIGSGPSEIISRQSGEIRESDTAINDFWHSGGSPVLLDSVDVSELIQRHILRYIPIAVQKGLSLHANFPKSGLYVQINPALFGIMLTEILSGLIQNAPRAAKIVFNGYIIKQRVVIDLISQGPVICDNPHCETLLKRFSEAMNIRLSFNRETDTGVALCIEFDRK